MPQHVPLAVYRGDTGHWTFTFYSDPALTIPFDLNGTSVKAEIRARSGIPVLADLVCVTFLPNTVGVDLPAAASGALKAGQAVWDLQVTWSSGVVRTIVAGPVYVTADVTDSAP